MNIRVLRRRTIDQCFDVLSLRLTFSFLTLLFVLIWYSSLVSAMEAVPQSPAVAFFNSENAKDESIPEFEDAYAMVNGHTYHYVTAGKGPLIVFYHGFPSFWYMWKDQLDELAKHYRVVALDGLGINLSDHPDDLNAFKIENLAADLNELVKQINGEQQFILMGHDWGGALAWSYAQAYPENISKLVVFSAPPFNLFLELLATHSGQQTSSHYVQRLKAMAQSDALDPTAATNMWQVGYSRLVTLGLMSEPAAEQFKTALTRPKSLLGGTKWYLANIPEFADISDSDFWPSRTAATPVQAMLVWGADDGTFVPEFLSRLPQYAPNVRIEVIPGARHWPMFEASDRVDELLNDFLGKPLFTVKTQIESGHNH